MLPRSLLLSLALLGVILAATTIDGPFTIDENNYLVTAIGLRHGSLTVPGTAGLPPSKELLYFDPAATLREVTSTPVASTAPPLYAPFAVPLLPFGWRGLVSLNTLSLLVSAALAFALTKRFSTAPDAPPIAAASVAVGAYFVEYAQGAWPHLLAVALVTGALFLAAIALEERPLEAAAGAGLLAALASGVRYQNAFLLGCIGLGLVLLGRHRLRSAAAFAIGAAGPLIACSLINHARLGSWNPISKGSGYLPTPQRVGAASAGFLGDFLRLAWARIVDYSKAPSLAGTLHASFHTPHPESGAYVMVTAVKKAWLQSAPWILVGLLMLAVAWLPAGRFTHLFGRAPQRQLRLLSLVVIPTLAMFSASGINRTDGLCFNQRYFCELVPPVAIAMAWAVAGVGARRSALVAGGLTGAALAAIALTPHHLMAQRHYMVMYLPLGLAALLASSWALGVRARSRASGPSGPTAAFGSFLAFAVAASIGWAACIHVGDDVVASRILRASRRDYLRELRPYLADHAAVFAGGAIKDALGPIQLERDVVIATPALDHGATAGALLEAFLAQGRRVFFLPNVMPVEKLDELFAGKNVRYLGRPVLLIEVARR